MHPTTFRTYQRRHAGIPAGVWATYTPDQIARAYALWQRLAYTAPLDNPDQFERQCELRFRAFRRALWMRALLAQ